ncbi:hypothetical protein [Mycobacteroides abscessus]|uniref:Uncharacterized protein n=1 Tax=Mycobacteroides abscessus TaxID=36809 RepID=A0A0U0ZKC7_9MYCO|nr:hypothetical protein [Mycobacteroides abscessus]SKS60482.1 Uncharacterised protein [Mycobacteroides abscessus subsp. abscessus]MBL3734895.1 hypothetical protein [Mycobacteroides abscessus subsp. massiliense]MBL3745396.1 hypothetical protein [Mycobacteroides abscessus subsp. massiliense]MBL3760231.1 hypothetical protein [Mycobacteroides abscessus subsp. massiliense]MBN7483816.1 hypothetical protein [Mycobacteroides abscessus subsp. massiliense]
MRLFGWLRRLRGLLWNLGLLCLLLLAELFVTLLWRLLLLRGLIVGICLPRPLRIGSGGLVIGDLRAVSGLLGLLGSLLCALLGWNLLGPRRTRVVNAYPV